MIYSHYSRLMAEAMDRGRPHPDAGQLDFLTRYLRRDAPNLELACGTGRLLYPIARLGYEICGIDSSPEMLERCQLKAQHYGFRVPVSQQFMQTFALDRAFGLIFIADCSFDLLYTEADQRATLRNIRRHLLPGGALLFDTETVPDPAWFAAGQSAQWSSFEDGHILIVSRKIFRYNPDTYERPGLQIHEYYIDGILQETRAYEDPMRYNDPAALCAMLAEEGFQDIAVGRYQSDDPPLHTVGELASIRCRKPAA